MNIEQYNFHLPEHLIAQKPLANRAASRLLVLQPETGQIVHDTFSNIDAYLQKGDCLVVNDSKVIPVRLFGTKRKTGAKIEILLLHETNEKDEWEALVKPARKIKRDDEIIFGNGELIAKCVEELPKGARILKLQYEGIFLEVLDKLGEMPLPPYIKEKLEDKDRYQTVYAKEEGSAAAPTAGLHFTEELLHSLKARGIQIASVTLHVGLGTFRPITAELIEDHVMHAEFYRLSEKNANLLNQVKQNGGKIIAVGTTATRVLETVIQKGNGRFKEASGWTDIFIYPPYSFQAIDGLITNFHLPKSSLLLLISALVNKEIIFQTYKEAIEEEYRFFSFGDAMFILPKDRQLDI